MNQARAWAHPGNGHELEEQCDDEGDREDDLEGAESGSIPADLTGLTGVHLLTLNKRARTALHFLLQRLEPKREVRRAAARQPVFSGRQKSEPLEVSIQNRFSVALAMEPPQGALRF
jgi:hypothetical protein